jgi:Zn-dependent peptidase ImmA (M78 family)
LRRADEEYEYVEHRGPLSSAGTEPEEIYANNFAASLLMPEAEVRRLFKEGLQLYQMAQTFDVSQEAVAYRLRNLGLG